MDYPQPDSGNTDKLPPAHPQNKKPIKQAEMNKLIKLEYDNQDPQFRTSYIRGEKDQNIRKCLKPDDGDFHLLAKEMQLVSSN